MAPMIDEWLAAETANGTRREAAHTLLVLYEQKDGEQEESREQSVVCTETSTVTEDPMPWTGAEKRKTRADKKAARRWWERRRRWRVDPPQKMGFAGAEGMPPEIENGDGQVVA